MAAVSCLRPREAEAVRGANPIRPVLMNGFLPTSAPVRMQQWWRTRDQGDSLSVAQQHADIVGMDYYPRHALGPAAGGRLPERQHEPCSSGAERLLD